MSHVDVVKMIRGIRPAGSVLDVVDHEDRVYWYPMWLDRGEIHAVKLRIWKQIGHLRRQWTITCAQVTVLTGWYVLSMHHFPVPVPEAYQRVIYHARDFAYIPRSRTLTPRSSAGATGAKKCLPLHRCIVKSCFILSRCCSSSSFGNAYMPAW